MKLLDSSNPWLIVGLFAFLGGVSYGMPLTVKDRPSEKQFVAFVAMLDKNTAEADAGRTE